MLPSLSVWVRNLQQQCLLGFHIIYAQLNNNYESEVPQRYGKEPVVIQKLFCLILTLNTGKGISVVSRKGDVPWKWSELRKQQGSLCVSKQKTKKNTIRWIRGLLSCRNNPKKDCTLAVVVLEYCEIRELESHCAYETKAWVKASPAFISLWN